MLLSMTGHGEARGQTDSLHLGVEVRSVNNRYLKLILRAPEPYALLEAEFEKVVRRTVRRGSVQIQVRIDRPASAGDFRLNSTALRSYIEQIWAACEGVDHPRPNPETLFGQILALPGVVPEAASDPSRVEEEWPAIERVLTEALARLQEFRQEEGARMADELLGYRDAIAERLDAIRARTPSVVAGFRDRLLERVRGLLRDSGSDPNPADLIREVSIFAERSDIAEEVTRLASHLEQFEQTVRHETDAPGRKLEFVVQEMGRETNTIGSKASDVEISRHAVEIKATMEKIRELIQNVE